MKQLLIAILLFPILAIGYAGTVLLLAWLNQLFGPLPLFFVLLGMMAVAARVGLTSEKKREELNTPPIEEYRY